MGLLEKSFLFREQIIQKAAPNQKEEEPQNKDSSSNTSFINHGLLFKAAQFNTGSLLKKAENLREKIKLNQQEHGEENSFAFLKKQIIELTEKEYGLNFLSQLFEILGAGLQLKKAALFVLDYRSNSFFPFFLYGYDETSKNRLRFPEHFFTGQSPAPYIRINPQSNEFLKQIFSSREYNLLDELYIFPLLEENGQLFSFLLSSTVNKNNNDIPLQNFTKIIPPISQENIYGKHFTERLKAESQSFDKKTNLKEIILQLRKEDYLLFSALINFNELFQKLIKLEKYIDQNYIHNELDRLLKLFCAESGHTEYLGSHYYLMLLQTRSRMNKNLISFQLKKIIQKQFKGLELKEDVVEAVFYYPDDISDPEFLIRSILLKKQ